MAQKWQFCHDDDDDDDDDKYPYFPQDMVSFLVRITVYSGLNRKERMTLKLRN
jgi:hypothetical protein